MSLERELVPKVFHYALLSHVPSLDFCSGEQVAREKRNRILLSISISGVNRSLLFPSLPPLSGIPPLSFSLSGMAHEKLLLARGKIEFQFMHPLFSLSVSQVSSESKSR